VPTVGSPSRVLLIAIVIALAGCSQAIQTPLPELASISRHLLSDAEQKKAIEEMNLERQRHEADAVKEIERNQPSSTNATSAAPATPLTNRSE
jgi:hypothetical protein